MSWHFKDIARNSALSESVFLNGEQVVCLIYKDVENNEIGRADIRADEEDDFELPGKLLGRWIRLVNRSGDTQPTVREKVASVEDFFFSLYESSNNPDSSEEVDALKYLIALMLERKRVVRAQGKRQRIGTQSYLHVKTGKTLDVPIVDISGNLLIQVQEAIGDIIL